MENEMEILNPDVKDVMIGKRVLRKLTLYPLSVVDQFKVTDLFTEAIGALLANRDMKDIVLISLFTTTVKINLPKILELVLDPSENIEEVMSQITNNQLSEIANVLYASNYELISKNVGSLLKKIPEMSKGSLLGRPLPSSVESTDTDSKTFSGNLGEMEE